MDIIIKCVNCGYKGPPHMMFKATRPTSFCPECGTSDVEVQHGS